MVVVTIIPIKHLRGILLVFSITLGKIGLSGKWIIIQIVSVVETSYYYEPWIRAHIKICCGIKFTIKMHGILDQTQEIFFIFHKFTFFPW